MSFAFLIRSMSLIDHFFALIVSIIELFQFGQVPFDD